MSFRYRLALFLVVTLVAVQALTAAVAYLYLRHNLVERAKRELTAEMGAFTRQLEFLSERVTDAVKVSSLDYALRAAIAQHDRNTELSALRNHAQRIGATRMMLVGLNGSLEMDTARPARRGGTFPFPALLGAAAAQDQASGLAAVEGEIYWVVAVPVRAPVPIGSIVAFIPVDSVLLAKLRTLTAQPGAVVLATRTKERGSWHVASKSGPRLSPVLTIPSSGILSSETIDSGHHYITVGSRLETTKDSAPVAVVVSYSLDEALSAYRSLALPLLALLTLALIAAVTGAMLIVRTMSRPLELLAGSARRIAAGDYSDPPVFLQRDEIGHLSDALGAMTRSIAEREAALRHAVQSAEFARNEAVRANEAKSQFLANMSHELRTPLNAIVGFSEMLEGQVLGPVGVPRYLDYAHDIRASGGQLLGQIERMLDLAKAEANRLTVGNAPLDLVKLLEHAVKTVKPFADTQKVRLAFSNSLTGSVRMNGDAPRLRQAIANIIHNAVKFTPVGGEIGVNAGAEHDRIAIQIVDHGIGMPPDLLDSVVRPFHRLRSALDGQHQGVGLGLPFAKAIVELHGGALSLQSREGIGTTVTIELPRHNDAIGQAA
jgi:signal transduction histidine kinase